MKKFSKILIIATLIIGYIVSGLATYMLASKGFFGSGLFDEITKGKLSGELEALIFFLVIGFLYFLMLNLMLIPIYIIRIFRLSKNAINMKYRDTKEYIYTRDLPEYNSAVAGELMDFKTTFEQEYVAAVMELIAKGYIIEHEKMLSINNSKSTEKLLKNEKYILRNCQHIKNSNYSKYAINQDGFYKELKEDMYDLGFYKKKRFFNEIADKILYYFKKITKQQSKIRIYLIYLIFLALPILFYILVNNLWLLILLYLIILVLLRRDKLTKTGELEKEKIGKLKLFLEKEMNFKDRENSERRLWDRYSAFAVAFGLNTSMIEEIKNKILNK